MSCVSTLIVEVGFSFTSLAFTCGLDVGFLSGSHGRFGGLPLLHMSGGPAVDASPVASHSFSDIPHSR